VEQGLSQSVQYLTSTEISKTTKTLIQYKCTCNIVCMLFIISNLMRNRIQELYDHVTPLLRELNWLPVDKLLYFRDISLTYKCVNNLALDYICNKLTKRSSIHDRRTRTYDSLQIPLFKTAAGQRSFTYRAVHIWNNLDKNLKDCSSLKTFKVAQNLLAKDNI
jgi:hypothetical protein